jgi:hypothetical protein
MRGKCAAREYPFDMARDIGRAGGESSPPAENDRAKLAMLSAAVVGSLGFIFHKEFAGSRPGLTSATTQPDHA